MIDPNEFFGTPDPEDEELAYISTPTVYTDPFSGVRVSAPGEDLSTLIDDPLTSVKDVRTPEQFLPFEAIVADLLGVSPNNLRLVKGEVGDVGTVAIFEELGDTFDVHRYAVASYAGTKPRVAYTITREQADARYAVLAKNVGVSPWAPS
jgi:hypothetical protein